MKKIIVFYASYGGGHFSAAKSVAQYIGENYPMTQVEIIDCMKYVSGPLEKMTTAAYREMAKKAPKLWGKVYSGSEKGFLSAVSKDSNKLMAKKLNKVIQEFNPDLIISTHPFSSQMVSYLKSNNLINCSLATIMTDFAIHQQWLIGHEFTNFFFVSNDIMKQDMVNCGIDENKIFVTGIPMSNRFRINFDRQTVCEDFNLDPEKKVILFFGGGEFGLGKERTSDVLKALISNLPDYQIVAISGKNEKMKENFEHLVADNNAQDRVVVISFTDKVPELMSISCCVVTKPGGLTTTESLVSGLPMIIINPIPGQEEANAGFLESNGVGVWIKVKDNPDEIISNLFSSEKNLSTMKENTKKLAHKDATKQICEIILGSNN